MLPFGAPLPVPPGCKLDPSVGSSYPWGGFHLLVSGGRPAVSSLESGLLTPPRNQPTSEQEIPPLPKEWETAEEERNETEGKAEEEGEGDKKQKEKGDQ